MGIASLGGLLSGAGDVKAPKSAAVGNDYLGLVNAYIKGQPKILDAERKFRPQYDALSGESMTRLASNLSGVLAKEAPGMAGIVRSISPSQTSLLDTLTAQASDELRAGTGIDPTLRRTAEQAVRGASAARGLGYSPSDVVMESSALTQLGNSLRRERQALGSSVAGMANQFETQPTLEMLLSLIGGAGALSKSTGATVVPTSLSGQLLTMPYQGRLSAATSTAANNTGLYQSMDANQSSFISSL